MTQREFSTQFTRFGAGGENLRAQPDVCPPHQLTRYINALRLRTGSVTGRAGQTALTNAPAAHTTVHSYGRLNTPTDFQRIWGIDQDLYYGKTGLPTLADSGYSGNPLTMLAADPPIPGAPWMYVADSARMRAIRSDGVDREIGLPAGVLNTISVQTGGLENQIELFTGTAGWTGYVNPYDPSAGTPTFATVTDPLGAPNNAFSLQTDPGTDPANYENYADLPIGPLDLSEYASVTPAVPATDDDFMHLWIQWDGQVTGFHLYLVSGTFTPGTPPGTSPGVNETAARLVMTADPALGTTWHEFGIAARPLRRSQFTTPPGCTPIDWSNVTGLVLFVQVGSAVNATLNLWDFTETSTRTSADVAVPYDYRVTNYDPRTGVEGNPSPVQDEGNRLTNLGTYVIITPVAYGDAAVRQRAYRRGGTLTDNWYLVGENTSDGGTIIDSSSDQAIEAAPTVQTDHDQPVTTVDADGTTVLNQPIPILFGPVQGLFFGLGVTQEPSTVFWTLPDRPDYWPATYKQQACAATELLQTGCVWGGEGYVASNARWFRLIPNISDAAIVTIQPTGATKGVRTRWAMIVGPVGVEYISDDGWYLHTGGPQQNLSDEEMYPLFNGETANGFLPIDFSVPTALRMGTYLNEVWLRYVDTNGDIWCLVRNTQTREFRHVQFSQAPAGIFGELEDLTTPPKLLIIGGQNSGQAYTHTGTADDGDPIPVTLRTAALDQGSPRNRKQYGDLVTSYQANGIAIDVEAFLDDEGVALGTQTLPTGAGHLLEVLNPFGDVPTEGRNISVEYRWTTTAAPPVLNFLGVSHLLQPDTTVTRLTDWDDGGIQAEKHLKGLVLECDTGGLDKTVLVEGTLYNGAVFTVATLTVNANGQRKLAFSWDQVPVSMFRIRPTDAHSWLRWQLQWIFDELPLRLGLWQTDRLTFGAEWSSLLYAYICYQGADPVLLTHRQWNEAGDLTSNTYVLPAAPDRVRRRQTFQAGKGVLHQLYFQSASDFLLFREETHFLIKPWNGDPLVKHPLGNDDLSLVRGSQSASGTAAAPGGGEAE